MDTLQCFYAGQDQRNCLIDSQLHNKEHVDEILTRGQSPSTQSQAHTPDTLGHESPMKTTALSTDTDHDVQDRVAFTENSARLSARDVAAPRADASASLQALVLPVRFIAGVGLLTVLVVGKSVFIPLALATLVSLGLRPLVRGLLKFGRVPAPLTAALLTCIIGMLVSTSLYALGEPAKEWLREAPHALRTFQKQASTIRGPLDDIRDTSAVIAELGGGASNGETSLVITAEPSVEGSMMMKTSEGVAYAVATLTMLFFILGWGDRLFRNLISLLPGFSEQRGVVEMVHAIETGIAKYLMMITVINACLGLTVTALGYYIGLPNPALWGVLAGLLNFMPYIGAAVTGCVLLAVSLVAPPPDYPALTAPIVFLLITTFEGYVITPYAVGKSLTLNPLVIFFSLLVCFFLWGGIGALFTVPFLVCCKVALEGSGKSGTLLARVLS